MIRIRQLSKSFGRARVLDGIDLDVAEGESVALWGSNGAGKTTIIRCITGIYRHEGSIAIDNLDTSRHGKAARQRIGYVPQEAGLYDDFRVAEAVAFFARLRGLDGVDESALLSSVGLCGHERKRVRQCSGGMKQRLSLAIAMLGSPPVMLLDEVTASLDAVGRTELIGLLSTITKSSNRAILFASHRIEEIAALATRVLVLKEGRVQRDVPVATFVHEYAESSILHLFMPREHIAQAMAILADEGIDARVNGHGILVPVRPGDRMRPIDILRRDRVVIDDFEMLSGDRQEANR
jgi:ABC-2 type transport system ATP-binding protein/nitrous oxidase accessory protein